jgi:transcriptional antiterminator NusG
VITSAITGSGAGKSWIQTGSQPFWYAVYTRAHHEKKASEELSQRGVENFLPLYRTARRWSDRRVDLELPLFPGYVFVHLALQDRLRVLQVPGVVRLVGFGGLATPLPIEEIEVWRGALDGQLRIAPHPYLRVGRRVRLKRGPLAGMEGFLLRRKGNFRVVILIELIQRAVEVDADEPDLEVLPSAKHETRALSI